MAWTQGRSGGDPKATNFAVACNLLSQYIKEKGSVAELGLAAAPRAVDLRKAPSMVVKLPMMTMSLLPGADVGDDHGEKDRVRSPMDLFPMGTVDDSVKNPNLRESEKAQLTIFYGGKVLVFDDFPAEKAQDLMSFASKGTENVKNFGYVAPSLATAAKAECRDDKALSASVSSTVATEGQAEVLTEQKISDLPIARKVSLHRFLERRKDRINARAPYQTTGSSDKPTAKSDESKSWLGLSPQVSEHTHS